MVNSYIAVDLETTGLNPKLDKIIEIGAVRVEDGREVDRFETFVNPCRILEEKIRRLTGISDDQLASAPEIGEVLPYFLQFAKELPLLGHHIIFDYSFLKKAAVNLGRPFEREGIDTLEIARKFMPQDEKKNLKDACRYYGVEEEPSHRALSDAKAAHQLYQNMKKNFGLSMPQVFLGKRMIFQVKKEQLASKIQKEHLQDLIKYHRISLTVQIDALSRNEISRMTDKIIAQYGRIKVR